MAYIKIFLFLIIVSLLSSCSSLTLTPAEFGWPIEGVLKIDKNGFVKEDRNAVSFDTKALFLEETQDSLGYAGKTLHVIRNHEGFYPLIRKAFLETGVIFVILPNIAGSKTNGATKKIGENIMLMVNDRRLNADSFWFTLFHEIGHIINGDYGISFEKETGEQEEAANKFAQDSLIPNDQYQKFVGCAKFDLQSIKDFLNLGV